MIVKTLTKDHVAIDFVKSNFNATQTKNKLGVITWESDLGGLKSVGVYSLPHEKMFMRGKSGKNRQSISIYKPEVVRDTDIGPNCSTRRKNRYMRATVQPTSLKGCDLYLAINRDLVEGINQHHVASSVVKLTKVEIPRAKRLYGGAITYLDLPSKRVIYPHNTETTAKFVWYGTSSIHNLAELFMTMKAGHHLGLPVQFDSYGSAVSTQKALEMLGTSVRLLNPNMQGNNLKLLVSADSLDENKSCASAKIHMGAFAEDLGLKSIKRKLPRLPQTIADHYRLGMQEVAKKMLEALGIKQKISITSTEDLLSNVMDTTLRILARSVEHKHGHTVRLLNNLTGGKVDTQSIFESSLGNRTLAEACSREFHASGAVIYQAFYTHSIRKSFVALVYDGNKGGIHKIAIEYMNEHGLWICPVGACEIYPRNAPKFHHLDPWVFLELLERWGKNKAHEYLKGIWDLLEVPLPSGNIGKKTKILVDLDGIKVLTD